MNESASAGPDQGYLVSGDDAGSPGQPAGLGGHITAGHVADDTTDGDVTRERPEPLEGYEHL